MIKIIGLTKAYSEGRNIVTENGHIILPKNVVERLGLKPDREEILAFVENKHGDIIITKVEKKGG